MDKTVRFDIEGTIIELPMKFDERSQKYLEDYSGSYKTYSLYDSTAISLPIATLSGVSTGYDSIGIKPDYEVQPSSDSQSEGASSDESDPCIKKAMEILSQQR